MQLEELIHNSDFVFYSHITHNDEICKSIISNGFYYDENFYKTSDILMNDEAYLSFLDYQRRSYGDYMIIFAFEKPLILALTELANTLSPLHEPHFYLASPKENDNNYSDWENCFWLSPNYIRGYFHKPSSHWVENPNFNPSKIPLKTRELLKKNKPELAV